MLAIATAVLLFAPAAAGQYAYRVEPNHSSISFVVPIAGGMTKVRGSFTKFTVEMVHDEKDLAKWSVRAVIEVSSVNTGIADRDKHLQAPEFFDAANHPQIIFQSTRVVKRNDRYVAYGDLTMRGVTRPTELEFVITRYDHDPSQPDSRPRFGASAHTTVNRMDFKVGADWKHTVIPNFLGNEITVEIDLWTRSGEKLPAGPPAN